MISFYTTNHLYERFRRPYTKQQNAVLNNALKTLVKINQCVNFTLLNLIFE